MLRRVSCVIVVALAAAPLARADGGSSPGFFEGWNGVAAGGTIRYVTLSSATETIVAVIQKNGGRVVNYAELAGTWGIPAVAYDGSSGGLSWDGRTLVLASTQSAGAGLRRQSSFLVVDARRLLKKRAVLLRGDFAFDALAPNGRVLYLIQHVSAADLTRYIVRAYDLTSGTLRPGAIADRTQRGWVMQGYPVTRATTSDGRWVYTLYQNPGGYPFIHALDTVRGTAHCVGLPWNDQSQIFNVRLSLRDGGRRLAIHWRNGTPISTMDTRTFRMTRASIAARSGGSAFPWWTLAVAGAGLMGVVLLVSTALRRHGRVEALPT